MILWCDEGPARPAVEPIADPFAGVEPPPSACVDCGQPIEAGLWCGGCLDEAWEAAVTGREP
jgi:hypothetical protein